MRDYKYNVQPVAFKAWLTSRLRQNKRDAIDALARRILADIRIPRQGSHSLYLAHLESKLYSAEDLATFEQAWQEMSDTQS
jgi:hypothetical protein